MTSPFLIVLICFTVNIKSPFKSRAANVFTSNLLCLDGLQLDCWLKRLQLRSALKFICFEPQHVHWVRNKISATFQGWNLTNCIVKSKLLFKEKKEQNSIYFYLSFRKRQLRIRMWYRQIAEFITTDVDLYHYYSTITPFYHIRTIDRTNMSRYGKRSNKMAGLNDSKLSLLLQACGIINHLFGG